MKVLIELKETGEAIEHDAANSYQKGDLFCVYESSGQVIKYPMANIWRIVHPYQSART